MDSCPGAYCSVGGSGQVGCSSMTESATVRIDFPLARANVRSRSSASWLVRDSMAMMIPGLGDDGPALQRLDQAVDHVEGVGVERGRADDLGRIGGERLRHLLGLAVERVGQA